MAMNKIEKAQLEMAKSELATVKALRWSRYEKLIPDVPPPITGHTEGFLFYSVDGGHVGKAWSERISHGNGDYPKDRIYRSARQAGIWIYSTRKLALQAMRYEIELRSAKQLAAIDALIEIEEGATK